MTTRPHTIEELLRALTAGSFEVGDDITFKLRRGVATLWTDTNPVLAEAEPGHETDTNKLKFGDGSTPWRDLPYFPPGGGGGDSGSGEVICLGDRLIGSAEVTLGARV